MIAKYIYYTGTILDKFIETLKKYFDILINDNFVSHFTSLINFKSAEECIV